MLSIYIRGLRRIITNVALDSHLGILRDDNVILDWLKEQKKTSHILNASYVKPKFFGKDDNKNSVKGTGKMSEPEGYKAKGKKNTPNKSPTNRELKKY